MSVNTSGKIRTWHLVLILIAVSLGPRIFLLLTTERTIDPEESLVGLMAMHISQGERPPIFLYGQHYGGGHVLEAVLAAPYFYFVDVSGVAVQAVPVVFSVATVVVVFLWMGGILGRWAGFACALVLSLSTPFLKFSFKANGYVETIFFGVLALFLFDRFLRLREEGKGKWEGLYAALVGLSLGIGWWSHDLILVYIGAVGIVGLASWKRLGRGPVPVFAFFFLLGASLLIYDNLTSDFENIKNLLYGWPRERPVLEQAAHSAKQLVRWHFAAFLTRSCIHNFDANVPLASWVYAVLIAFGAVVSFAGRRSLKLPPVLFVYTALFLVMYLISPHSGVTPRYFLPLEPFLSIFLVSAVVFLLRSRRVALWLAGAAISICIAVIQVFGVASIRADDGIMEGMVHTDKNSVKEAIEFLDSKGIDCVYTTFFIKYRILFETRERINAIYMLAGTREMTFTRYEDRGCPPSTPLTFVLHKRNEAWPTIISNFIGRGVEFDYHHTTDHMIVYAKENTD